MALGKNPGTLALNSRGFYSGWSLEQDFREHHRYAPNPPTLAGESKSGSPPDLGGVVVECVSPVEQEAWKN